MIEPRERTLRPLRSLTHISNSIRAFYRHGEEANLPKPGTRFYGRDFAADYSACVNCWAGRIRRGHEEVAHHCPGGYLDAVQSLKEWDTGNGHAIQRLHRLVGLPAPIKPKGFARQTKPTIQGRIAFSLEVASPTAMSLPPISEESKATVRHALGRLDDVVELGPLSAKQLDVLSECEYYVGIASGWMDYAAAMNKRSIILITISDPDLVVLPIIRNVVDPPMARLYPQNIHLHEDGAGGLVGGINKQDITRALDGRLYPYWSDAWLNLVNPEFDLGEDDE